MRRQIWRGAALCFLLSLALLTLSGMAPAQTSAGRLILICTSIGIAILIEPARMGRLSRVAAAADGLILFSVISATGAMASYLAMRNAGPFTDTWLAGADHLIGFDWPTMRDAVDHSPVLRRWLERAYGACFLLPAVTAGILDLSGRAERLHMMLAAFGIALALTVAIFCFFPAQAAFEHFGYRPLPPNAAHFGALIAELHGGRPGPVNLNSLGGIITFPSFHAAMAVIFAWALWPIRILRAANLAVNGLMWIAAVPIGGHYLVDLIGGSLVAAFAINAVSRNGITVARIKISPVQSGAPVPR
jgi:PAP2 superfamily